MTNYIIELVDIKEIQPSDTILHNDELKTVCKNNINYSDFMGRTLFGDSYMLGYNKVKKVTFITEILFDNQILGVDVTIFEQADGLLTCHIKDDGALIKGWCDMENFYTCKNLARTYILRNKLRTA